MAETSDVPLLSPARSLGNAEEKFRSIGYYFTQFLEGNIPLISLAAKVKDLSNSLEALVAERTRVMETWCYDMGGASHERGSSDITEFSAMESAMSTDLVLKHLFEYLSLLDLKECKKMNRVWNKIANGTLAQRTTFINSRNLRALKGRGLNVPGKFKELGNCMKNCTTEWLAPGIVMDSKDWELMKPEVREFLDNFGCRIKRLIVDFPLFLGFSGLVDLLVNDLPNLELLQIQQIGSSEQGIRTGDAENLMFPNGVLLPALKTLRLPAKTRPLRFSNSFSWDVPESRGYVTIVRGILYAAVNLKRIENFSCTFINDLIALNKLNTVQDINLISAKLNPEFAAADLKLKRIEIPKKIDSISSKQKKEKQIIQEVLNKCRNTVEELDIPMLTNLSEIIPVMLPALRIITFRNGRLTYLENTESIFPVLKEVNFQMDFCLNNLTQDDIDEQITNLGFLDDCEFPQVELLRMPSNFPMEMVLNIRHHFPNLTSLYIHWNMLVFQSTVREISTNPLDYEYDDPNEIPERKVADPLVLWKLRLPLKQLEIINFSMDNVCPDSFFTGLAPKICKKLRDRNMRMEMDLDVIRTEESICVFPGLRELRLRLRLNAYSKAELTCVSYWYGFGCIPGLQVILLYDHRRYSRISEAIETIKPFVTVIHED